MSPTTASEYDRGQVDAALDRAADAAFMALSTMLIRYDSTQPGVNARVAMLEKATNTLREASNHNGPPLFVEDGRIKYRGTK